MMEFDHVTEQMIAGAIAVHKDIGAGLLESTYTACLRRELHLRGMHVEMQVPQPVVYRGCALDVGYRLDLLVERTVIVEVKAVTKVLPIHEAQVLSYLRLSRLPVALLLNFHVLLMRDGIRRLVETRPR